MSSLQTIQEQMLHAVLAEKTETLGTICSDAIAGAEQRLSVYQRGYRIRLRDALKNEFAGLQCMAGRHFLALLDAYVTAHPSEHSNIRWHGADLASFLEETPPWCERPQLAEMAYLDWAISTAFDAADEPNKNMADLAAVPPEAWANLRLRLQSHLRMISVTHNVDAFRRAADGGGKRPRLRHLARSRCILVWRTDMTVHYRTLEQNEQQVLTAAIHGETFASLCERLALQHGQSLAMSRMVQLLQSWLEAGLIQGWSTDQPIRM